MKTMIIIDLKNEVVMDKAIYVGFTILELSNLHMYETYYDTLQPYFGQENLQLHCRYRWCDFECENRK